MNAHGAKDLVLEIRKARTFDAFVIEAGRLGIAATEVRNVCRLAGVTVKGFYETFTGGKSTCAAQAFAEGSNIVCGLGETAYARALGPWEVRLHSALFVMLDVLSSNPSFARFAIAEMQRDLDGESHFEETVSRCRRAFGGPRPLRLPGPSAVDVAAYEAVLIGAALGPLERAVIAGRAEELPDLARAISYALALPVVGPTRAARVLGGPSPG